MLWKVSVDEVFMHYFQNMSSASAGGVLRRSPPGLPESRPLRPNLPTPVKNSCRREWTEAKPVAD